MRATAAPSGEARPVCLPFTSPLRLHNRSSAAGAPEGAESILHSLSKSQQKHARHASLAPSRAAVAAGVASATATAAMQKPSRTAPHSRTGSVGGGLLPTRLALGELPLAPLPSLSSMDDDAAAAKVKGATLPPLPQQQEIDAESINGAEVEPNENANPLATNCSGTLLHAEHLSVPCTGPVHATPRRPRHSAAFSVSGARHSRPSFMSPSGADASSTFQSPTISSALKQKGKYVPPPPPTTEPLMCTPAGGAYIFSPSRRTSRHPQALLQSIGRASGACSLDSDFAEAAAGAAAHALESHLSTQVVAQQSCARLSTDLERVTATVAQLLAQEEALASFLASRTESAQKFSSTLRGLVASEDGHKNGVGSSSSNQSDEERERDATVASLESGRAALLAEVESLQTQLASLQEQIAQAQIAREEVVRAKTRVESMLAQSDSEANELRAKVEEFEEICAGLRAQRELEATERAADAAAHEEKLASMRAHFDAQEALAFQEREQHIASLEVELASCRSQQANLAAESTAEAAALQARVEALQAEKEEAIATAALAQEEAAAAFSASVQQLQAEAAAAADAKAQAHAAVVAQLQEQLAAAAEQHQQVEAQLRAEAGVQEQRLAQLDAQMQSMVAAHATALAEQTQRAEEAMSCLLEQAARTGEAHEAQLASVRATSAEAQAQLASEHDAALASLRAEHVSTQSALEEARAASLEAQEQHEARVAQLERRIAELEEREHSMLANAEAAATGASESSEQQQKQTEQARAAHAATKEQLLASAGALAAAERAALDLESSAESLRAQNERLQSAADSMELEAAGLAAGVQRLTEANAQLVQRVAELEARVAELQGDHAAQVETLQRRVVEAEECRAHAEEQATLQGAQVAQLQQRLHEQKNELTSQRTESAEALAASAEVHDTLQAKLGAAQEQHASSTVALAEAQRALAAVQGSLAALEAANAALIAEQQALAAEHTAQTSALHAELDAARLEAAHAHSQIGELVERVDTLETERAERSADAFKAAAAFDSKGATDACASAAAQQVLVHALMQLLMQSDKRAEAQQVFNQMQATRSPPSQQLAALASIKASASFTGGSDGSTAACAEALNTPAARKRRSFGSPTPRRSSRLHAGSAKRNSPLSVAGVAGGAQRYGQAFDYGSRLRNSELHVSVAINGVNLPPHALADLQVNIIDSTQPMLREALKLHGM